MDFLQGFSQCSWPGQTCHVNWTAWAAIATVILGWLAWRTAVAAKNIARRQHEQAELDRDALGQIRGRLLLNEVFALQGFLAQAQNHLHLARIGKNGSIRDADALRHALRMAHQNPLPLSIEQIDHLHFFPDKIGHDLATLIGWVRTMNVAAEQIEASGFEESLDGLQYVAPTNEDFIRLSHLLHDFFEMSRQFAGEFTAYLGLGNRHVDPKSYLGVID